MHGLQFYLDVDVNPAKSCSVYIYKITLFAKELYLQRKTAFWPSSDLSQEDQFSFDIYIRNTRKVFKYLLKLL